MNRRNYLQGKVLAELHRDSRLRRDHIRVIENNDTVVLSGSVRSEAEKAAAEHAAGRVRGVAGIVQELEIVASDHQRSADELLAKNAVAKLAAASTLPTHAVKVAVENGAITLTGRVRREFQRTEAERLVRQLSGVVRVTNHIVVGRDAMAGL